MNETMPRGVTKAVDSVQQRLSDYAFGLNYGDLSPEAIHTAKARIIDTLGVLIGGFFGDACRITRNLAAQMSDPVGATVLGTRMKTTPDMAAFVNATTARYLEFSDFYHWPGSTHGHPSDVITPVLAAAEHARSSGSEFITGVVLAYEVYCRIADVFHNAAGFDNSNFACLGGAVGAGKVLGLSHEQLSHCISMAMVPNVVLRQVRTDHLSMWKEVAAGHAGRAGVFAALLARAGMEGPHLPFEGKAGWCEHVARERFSLAAAMGGKGATFKILDTGIRHRPCMGEMISSILAAAKIAPLRNLTDTRQVTVEVYKYARDLVGTGEHRWNPGSREAADHSIPYVVAATLMDGTLTVRSFNDSHLWNPELRALMQKIEVVENTEFTQAWARQPREHRTRVTVVTGNGERLVGEAGGGQDDLSAPKSDAHIVEKFRGLTEDALGAKRMNMVLERLWHLEDCGNVADLPPDLVLV